MKKLKFTFDDFNFDVTIEGHQGCDPTPSHNAAKAQEIFDKWYDEFIKLEAAMIDEYYGDYNSEDLDDE